MEFIIDYLKTNKKYISTMESATGGFIASSITNISGSSNIFKFGAVTYSNEFKIKMGVNQDVIDKYSVYSMECANSMSKSISLLTNSNYGVGITGKLNEADLNNQIGDDSLVYLSIYDKDNNKYYNKEIKVLNQKRILNKELILNEFINLFKDCIIKE
jgi:nicotinamide-nucleotide amidase